MLRSRAPAADDIRARLTRSGVRVHSVTPVAPSLEDVFLDVIDRAGNRAGSAA